MLKPETELFQLLCLLEELGPYIQGKWSRLP